MLFTISYLSILYGEQFVLNTLPCDMAAEFNTDTNCHHKVDQGHSIQSDAPPLHDSHDVGKNEYDCEDDGY